jgi:hypothetical protein
MAKNQFNKDPGQKYRDKEQGKWVRVKPVRGKAYMELRDENGKVIRRK